MNIIKILKTIEPYYKIFSYIFIGFFIAMTGVTIIPMVAKSAQEGSLAPLFYALSIMFAVVYFTYYKVVRVILNQEKIK